METHERPVAGFGDRDKRPLRVRDATRIRQGDAAGAYPYEGELDQLCVTFDCRLVEHAAQAQLVEQ